MTNHDHISSFIDNELNHDQETDFLISLASSEALRKSFRSELVLKNIIHRDEVLTSPSRDLRPAVLATVGIAAATLAASETADAATTTAAVAKTSVLKTLFATKIGAMVTASVVTVSALGGYAVHSYVATNAAAATQSVQHQINTSTQPAPQTLDVQTPETSAPATLGSAPVRTAVPHTAVKKHGMQPSDALAPTDFKSNPAAVTITPEKK